MSTPIQPLSDEELKGMRNIHSHDFGYRDIQLLLATIDHERSLRGSVIEENLVNAANAFKYFNEIVPLKDQLEKERSLRKAAEKEHDEEIGDFQNEVRDKIIKLTGAPDSVIDGKGSDAGWQEFTLVEISQGIAHLKDSEIEPLKKQLLASQQTVERMRESLNNLAILADRCTPDMKESYDKKPLIDEIVEIKKGNLETALSNSTPSVTNKNVNFITCGSCGVAFDMRQLDQVTFHESDHAPRIATGITGSPVTNLIDREKVKVIVQAAYDFMNGRGDSMDNRKIVESAASEILGKEGA